jgi:hypothetical protein
MLKKTKAQSLGEYVLMISIILAFVAAMFPLVKRGTQSLIKAGADQIGDQRNSDQDFNSDSGYTVGSNTIARSDSSVEQREWSGGMGTSTNELSDVQANTYSNLGFTEEK